MRISTTLCVYIGRRYLTTFLLAFCAVMSFILLADTIELLRRVAGKPDVTFALVVEMAILKLPIMGQKIFPFIALFAGMAVFWRMSRSHELEVVRSAGVSAWQFLLPAVAVALMFGVLQVTVLNPLASAFFARYEREVAIHIERKLSTLALRGTGLWLREGDSSGQTVVHAVSVLQIKDQVELSNVSVFRYEGLDHFVGRIDAARATLEPGYWELRDVWILDPEEPSRHLEEYRLPTQLTRGRIENSFASPETISFWDLPGFIETLESSGFSAVGHRLHFNALLATPLLMCAMVFIAATFGLRHVRRGGMILVVAGGLVTGFVLHIFSDIVFALGLADRVPPVLAGWTPAIVAALFGVTMLLYLEDG